MFKFNMFHWFWLIMLRNNLPLRQYCYSQASLGLCYRNECPQTSLPKRENLAETAAKLTIFAATNPCRDLL